ncbi:hypothetical protein ABTX77_41955 [Streptomyces sp. NPDC097704]|uniref:hypothetical protein n=1 Tax=Streptomyces sp. NPDC097704 TaxID=3157101 RepID=UPI003326F945
MTFETRDKSELRAHLRRLQEERVDGSTIRIDTSCGRLSTEPVHGGPRIQVIEYTPSGRLLVARWPHGDGPNTALNCGGCVRKSGLWCTSRAA